MLILFSTSCSPTVHRSFGNFANSRFKHSATDITDTLFFASCVQEQFLSNCEAPVPQCTIRGQCRPAQPPDPRLLRLGRHWQVNTETRCDHEEEFETVGQCLLTSDLCISGQQENNNKVHGSGNTQRHNILALSLRIHALNTGLTE